MESVIFKVDCVDIIAVFLVSSSQSSLFRRTDRQFWESISGGLKKKVCDVS
eukprot:Awhi_evm2s4415